MKKVLSTVLAITMVFGCAAAVPGNSESSTVMTASAEACATTIIESMAKKYANAKDIDVVLSSNGYAALTAPDCMDINIYNLTTGGNVKTVQKRRADDVLLGLRGDLTVITCSWHEEEQVLSDVLFYTKGSNTYTDITVARRYLYFDDDKIYYLNEDKIFTVDEEGTHEKESITPGITGSFRTTDPLSIKQGGYFKHKRTNEDDMFPEYDLYLKDLYTGDTKTTMELKGYSGNPERGRAGFTSDSIVFDPKEEKYDAKLPYITCFDSESGAIKYSFEKDRYCNYYFSDKSPYAFIGYEEPNAEDKEYIRTDDGYLRFVDPRNGKMAKIAAGGEGMLRSEGFCLEENKWLVYVVYKTAEGTDTEFYYVDLEKEATFDIQLKGKTEWYPVTDDFKEARKKADEIEEKYGVTIVFGDEVIDMDDPYLDTFKDKFYYQGRLDEKHGSMVERMEMLDSRMSNFPEGFFREFQDENGKYGYLFRFGDFMKGGVAYSSYPDPWYVFTGNMDCSNGYALEHESYHAMESLISKLYPIPDEEWEKLDPEGFERFNVWADDAVFPNSYLKEGDCDDPYFLTKECMGNCCEDRSIMIGNLFLNSVGDETYEYSYFPQHYLEYSKYPHLKAKYDYIEQWEKDYFGYAHWKIAIGLEEMPMKGDVTLDGKIEIDDAVSVIGYVNGQISLKRGPLKYAEVSGPDKVDIEDAVTIINHINGVKKIE